MPVFNRVRIVNIRYDHREITDNLFDYYGGCNALMNLANGSGKTVMVETLFQPIYPNMSVGKWKIIDYLTGDQRPTFVIIEWLLDGTREPTYFMTGICLSFTKIPQEEQPGRALKYFTFTHTYTKGNAYDIEHIPLLPEKGEHTKYLTYDETWNLLKKYTATHPEFLLFRKDRQKDYQVHLREHQIFPEEWELLKTINQEENGGGMSKLFEACKTSDLLFDRWILKKISDTNAGQRKSLMQALTELTLPMIESDEKLREKEQAEKVAAQLRQFEEIFGSYTDALDKKEQKERYLAGVLLHTRNCCQQKEQEIAAAQQTQEQCREEESHIRLEELSEAFHRLSDNLREAELNAERLTAQLPIFQEHAETAKRERRLMQAAEYKSNRIRAEQELQTAQNLLKTLEQGDEAERLQDLGFTLRIGYHHASQEAQETYTRIQRDLQANKQEQDRLTEQNQTLIKQQNDLTAQKAAAEQRLKTFDSEAEKYRMQIGSLPEKDMMGALIPESVSVLQDALYKAYEQAHQKVQDCLQQLDQTKQMMRDNRAAQEQLDELVQEAKEKLRAERSRMEHYQQQIAQITEILRQFEIDSKYLYEKEENIVRMREQCSALQAKQDAARRQLDRTEEILEKLKNNSLHTAPQFGRLLEENGIAFQTGEAYLKQQDRAFQEQLLAGNPLLPYCYLVNDADYQKVLSIPDDTFSDKLCPVLRRSEIDCTAQTDEHAATLGALRLYSLYDRESLDTSGQYAQKLISRRDDLTAKIQTLSDDLAVVGNAIWTMEQFTLTQETVAVQAQTVHNAEACVKQLSKEKEGLNARFTALTEQQETLLDVKECVKKQEQHAENRLSAWKTFLNLAEEAAKDRTALSADEQRLREISTKLRCCEDGLDELRETYQELWNQQSRAEQERDQAQRKMAEFAQYLDGELLHGDLRQLEMEYQPLHEKQSQDQSALYERCRQAQDHIFYNQNQLKILFLDLDDAQIPTSYDRTKVKTLEEREQSANEALTLYEQKMKQVREDAERFRAEQQKTSAALAEAGLREPLPPQKIKGDYQKRRKDNDQKQSNAQVLEKKSREVLKKLYSQRNDLDKLVDLEHIQDSTVTPIVNAVDLSAERMAFRALQAIADKQRKAMENAHTALRERYRDSDRWIVEMVSFIHIEECLTYSSCYYLYEQLKEKENLLHDQIQLLQTELSNIETNRSHIIRQIYEHADFLLTQVRDISANSVITLQGKRRKMLEIVLPDSLDSQAQQRIANLVDAVTLRLRQQITLDAQAENKLFEAICSCYADRVIFNAYTNLQTIRIRVLKILQDERNSRLENWEARYSGGERFITYMIAYSALADYTRRKANPNRSNKIRSVFLVDNPFGEASSDHLVGTLIEITQKFHMQLLCFSDLKQSSITNHFDLIYQLSMRRILCSNRSRLHTDNVINHTEASLDSHLEFVSMKSQLSFFDD